MTTTSYRISNTDLETRLSHTFVGQRLRFIGVPICQRLSLHWRFNRQVQRTTMFLNRFLLRLLLAQGRMKETKTSTHLKVVTSDTTESVSLSVKHYRKCAYCVHQTPKTNQLLNQIHFFTQSWIAPASSGIHVMWKEGFPIVRWHVSPKKTCQNRCLHMGTPTRSSTSFAWLTQESLALFLNWSWFQLLQWQESS